MLKNILEVLRLHQKITIASLLIFTVALGAVFYLSTEARYNQLKVWEKYPASFFATGTPMMTTLDAYKFTRHAKEYATGNLDTTSLDPMVFYPDGIGYQNPVPLLSVILHKISGWLGEDLYHTGTSIIPILSSLFIIPIALYFLFGGYPAAGIIAGIIGTFAPMYYGRTSMGRLDTDGMNVFFLIASSLFVMLAAKTKKPWQMYLFSGLAGLTVNLFYWWYQHGVFNICYAGLLVICLFLAKVKIKDIAISLVIFIILSNPLYMADALGQIYRLVNVYLFPLEDKAAQIFPNVYDTIGEAQRDSIRESLSTVIQRPELAAFGLICFVIFGLSNFRFALPLAPLALMGAVTFVSAGRFSMFLGPIVGIGLGYAASIAGSYAASWTKKYREDKTNKQLLTRSLIYSSVFVAICGVISLAVTTTAQKAFAAIPGPSIQPQIYQIFKDMNKELPKNSAIYTWWDYGLAIADVSGFPVFHGGSSQDSPKTWIMAKSLTGTQKELYNIASYLDTYGISEIKTLANDKKSAEDIAAYIADYSNGPKNDADYVLFTEDMVGKFYPMSYLATWKANGKGNAQYLGKLNCFGIKNDILSCESAEIDIKTGIINKGRATIKEAIITEDGKVSQRLKYGFAQGNALIINASKGQITGVYFFDANLIDTAFVQLYFLNEPNPEYFTLAMDRYPYGRLYRLTTKADGNGGK